MKEEDYKKIIKDIEELTESYKYAIDGLKEKIKAYFSEELQMDETPMGALKRNQIRKELLEFANR